MYIQYIFHHKNSSNKNQLKFCTYFFGNFLILNMCINTDMCYHIATYTIIIIEQTLKARTLFMNIFCDHKYFYVCILLHMSYTILL